MDWTITATQDDASWFEDYIGTAISSVAPELPAKQQKIGASTAVWWETEPGITVITTRDGSPDDRMLAEIVVREQLKGHGIHQAHFDLDWPIALRKEATWDDIMANAVRLLRAGNVQILRNGVNNIVGQVQGDHGSYQTEIGRDDPNSRTITTWQCECPWDQFAWQRTRQWKKYEGRVCKHVLATYWAALQLPTDEEAHPGNQQSLFNMPATPTGLPPSAPGMPSPAPQGQQLPIPGMMPGMAQGTPPGIVPPGQVPPGVVPAPPSVLPQFPMDPALQPVVNPVSTPGGKPPSPLNPMQWPGGTFSKVAAQGDTFNNGDMVQLLHDDIGTAMGKSEAHGSGLDQTIPAGSIGEVLGQDPTTKMVDAIFTGPAAQNGPMEPYYVRIWAWPSDLRSRPDIRKPGPAIRRR